MKKDEKIIIAVGVAIIAGLYFMPKTVTASTIGVNPPGQNTGGNYNIPAYVPTALPDLAGTSPNYSTNVPWWLLNNNDNAYQGVAPLLPLSLPNSTASCNVCSLMSNNFGL